MQDLDSAYTLDGPDENRELYAAWAKSYDDDFAREMDYRLPDLVAQRFVHAGGVGPVLDLGAGTGLCGAALANLGVVGIDGTDISEEMLDVAQDKQVYDSLFWGDVLARLPVDAGRYGGAVSSGTFTHGHVGPSALTEVLRVLEHGGLAVISVNAKHWHNMAFQAAFDELGTQVQDLEIIEQPIYGAGADGAHAQDTALIVSFRKR